MRCHHRAMQAVTIREAKARLHALVEAAERGEQVVLMRGAQHVALDRAARAPRISRWPPG